MDRALSTRSSSAPALAALTLLVFALIALFMTYDLQGALSYALDLRFRKVWVMALVGVSVAYASVLFQTVTNNRILTPSLMGFDSLYLLIQIGSSFLFGTFTVLRLDSRIRFGINTIVMVSFALMLYWWLFKKHRYGVHTVVLVGLVLGTMFRSLTSLAARLIDPTEFSAIQDQFFADFSTVESELLGVATLMLVPTILLVSCQSRDFDAVLLGRDMCVSLGVNHQQVVRRAMLAVSVLISVATALVGPVAFFGLLVANLGYQFGRTYQHNIVLPVAGLLGIVVLVSGQLFLEELLNFQTRISIVIDLIGGIFFIALLMKESKK